MSTEPNVPADMPEPVAYLFAKMREALIEAVGHGHVVVPLIRFDRRDEWSWLVAAYDPDEIYDIVRITPPLLGADRTSIGTDAWRAVKRLNPETGREWEPGDMARLGAKGSDAVTECLNICTSTRDASYMWSAGYERRPEGLWWIESEVHSDLSPSVAMGGDLYQAMSQGLRHEPFNWPADMDRESADHIALTVLTQQAHCDVWVGR